MSVLFFRRCYFSSTSTNSWTDMIDLDEDAEWLGDEENRLKSTNGLKEEREVYIRVLGRPEMSKRVCKSMTSFRRD